MGASDQLVRDLSSKVFSTAQADNPRDGFDSRLWAKFSDTGLHQLFDDVANLPDVLAVLQDSGRVGAVLPVAEVLLAMHLGRRAGWVGDGGIPLIAFPSTGYACVPWGRLAGSLYFLHDGRIARVRHVSSRRCAANLAGEPRDEVSFDASAVEVSTAEFPEDRLEALGALFRAALMAGAMQQAVRLSVKHANERVQFGRPIAKFQAIQQMLAVAAAQAAAATAAVELAGSSFSLLTAAVAKCRAGESVRVVCDAAHEVCGAMGYTAEFPLHRLSRRLWAWRDENGSEFHWSRWIGDSVIQRGNSGVWSLLTAPLST